MFETNGARRPPIGQGRAVLATGSIPANGMVCDLLHPLEDSMIAMVKGGGREPLPYERSSPSPACQPRPSCGSVSARAWLAGQIHFPDPSSRSTGDAR